MSINIRESLNAISDVVNNRPRPLRLFDQIFMKTADMLLQAELVGRLFADRRVIFIGDGDAIGLCLVHLHNSGFLPQGPKSVHVMDFDERVVLSVQQFAERYEITHRVTSELYNVVDPLPERHWQKFDGFYTNPPFGASNEGRSVKAFLQRGFEAAGNDAAGCLVIADHPDYRWTQEVLRSTQQTVLDTGYMISEMLPQFHHYHLDDTPDLTSCSMVVRKFENKLHDYDSKPLDKETLNNFYGKENPLHIKYIRDNTNGGKFLSRDYQIEPIEPNGG